MRRRLARLAGQQPLGAAGAVVVAAMIVAAIWAPQLAPYGAKDAAFAPYAPPGPGHPMGTDQLGRDVLSRVVWGARLSLYVGLVSVVLGVTLGSLWGVVSAYVGGMTDTLSQRVVDSLMALPPIVLALSLMAAIGQSVNNVIVALTILLTPTAARTLRAVALGIMATPFVEAAQAAGGSSARIIARHVLPNCLATYTHRRRRAARRALVGRHADGGHAGRRDRAVDDLLPGPRHQPGRARAQHARRRHP